MPLNSNDLTPGRSIEIACGIKRHHADQVRREAWAESCETSVAKLAGHVRVLCDAGWVLVDGFPMAYAVMCWTAAFITPYVSMRRDYGDRWILEVHHG